MDTRNTFEANTTIVGRPTYMATFPGTQDTKPIVEQLVGLGYPREDISILRRPAGSDAAVDLLSGENAAGQDADAATQLAKGGEATTLLILHPDDAQLGAVRTAVQALGGQEFEYEPETRFTGEDSEALVAQTTGANVSTTNAANKRAPGAPEPGRTEKDASKDSSPAAGAGTPTSTTATSPTGENPDQTARGSSSETHENSPARGAGVAAQKTESSRPQVDPLPDTSDLKGEITQLKEQVDQVRQELEERD